MSEVQYNKMFFIQSKTTKNVNKNTFPQLKTVEWRFRNNNCTDI